MSAGGDPGQHSRAREQARELAHAGRKAIADGQPGAALPLLEQAAELLPHDAFIHIELGRALNNLGRLPAARAAFEEAVQLDPNSAIAWNGLGHVSRRLGDLETAGEAFRCAVSLEPNSAPALANLASVHLSRGETEEGIRILRKAAAADPLNTGPRCQLGDALQNIGRRAEAETAYAEALEIDPHDADALAGLGCVMDTAGRHGEAERLLQKALSQKPGHPVAAFSLVELLELQDRCEEALSVLRSRPWSRTPDWAVVAEARQLFRLDNLDEAEARLAEVVPDQMDPPVREAALNLRGRILEARGQFGPAFREFEAANRVQPSRFNPSAFRDTLDRLIDFFTPDRLKTLPRTDCDSNRPVFIVGMPRSGSSLVEQMLASHSRVVAGGERLDFFHLPRILSGGLAAYRWPACLVDFEPGQLSEIANEYLNGCDAPVTGDVRITDKLPANFLNLGLVQLLFPRARVIYCRRDPMDTGLSCFQQNFRYPGMGFAKDLAHIGLYQNGCVRIMEHWRSVLDLSIRTVDYEELVSDPETVARAVVEFLGLEWEAACLRFHESGRVIRTASHQQVKRPIYTSSIGRWRQYREWLGPLRAALDAPWRAEIGPPNP